MVSYTEEGTGAEDVICGLRDSRMGIKRQRSLFSSFVLFPPGASVSGNDNPVHTECALHPAPLSHSPQTSSVLGNAHKTAAFFHPAPSVFNFKFIIKGNAITTSLSQDRNVGVIPGPHLAHPPHPHPSICCPSWLSQICLLTPLVQGTVSSPTDYRKGFLSSLAFLLAFPLIHSTATQQLE